MFGQILRDTFRGLAKLALATLLVGIFFVILLTAYAVTPWLLPLALLLVFAWMIGSDD